MDKKPILDLDLQSTIVDRLIVQYKEYLFLSAVVSEAETKAVLAKISGTNTSGELGIVKKIQNRLSDEMTFYTPHIWMLYKHRAYSGTAKEIATVSDFIDHCSPEGYICTKRFKFLEAWLKENKQVNIRELLLEDDSFSTLIRHPELQELETNEHLIQQWLEHEFAIVDNTIAKWQNLVAKN